MSTQCGNVRPTAAAGPASVHKHNVKTWCDRACKEGVVFLTGSAIYNTVYLHTRLNYVFTSTANMVGWG